MPPNTEPVFSLVPNVGKVAITAALTKSNGDGTIGTDIFKALTAGAEGSFVQRVRFAQTATTASTSTTATVGRVYFSTVGTGATTGGTDTVLLGEVSLPSILADNPTVPTSPIELMLNIAIPPGAFIHVSTHHAPAANSSIQATVFGGDF